MTTQSTSFVLLFLSFFLISPLYAEAEISRKAPAEFSQHILPQLTDYKPLLKQKDPFQESDDGGTVILRERVDWVHKDGRRLKAIHVIYKARTEQGIDALAQDSYSFDALLTKIHVVMARTVLPDGTIKNMADNGAFIERGKGDRSSQLYHSNKRLVLVFPDTQVGACTESIVVFEDLQPRQAGEYTSTLSWAPGWPIVKDRFVLDLPQEMQDRLKTDNLGIPAIAPEVEKLTARTRSTWIRKQVHSMNWETNRAPTSHVGPATLFSTNKDWNNIAQWYQKLLDPRSKLSPELIQKVDAWTKGAANDKEVIARLFNHAANDVRYTGLEFGQAGLQPYDCNLVWKNQYGDCKDKSNLLSAMLRHKGIESYVTLINTEHDGTVHQHLPSHRYFNHAIVAIKQNDSKDKPTWLFCDPTIRFGKPGLLSPSSSNRKVLIIENGTAVWADTPTSPAGTENYGFETKLSANGQISGWLTITSTGNYAIWKARYYHGLDRDSAVYRLNKVIKPFFAGAQVIDYKVPEIKDGKIPDEVKIKAFFTCPASQPNSENQLPVSFPKSSALFNDYGNNKNRQTDYYQSLETLTVNANIETGGAWSPTSLPTPFTAHTPHYEVSASWKYSPTNKKIQASLKLRTLKGLIPSKQVATAQQADRAIAAWLKSPILLKKGAGSADSGTPSHQAVSMPVMPTGTGQLDLVNRWFPSNGDRSKRKSALEKVIQLFPNDPNTIFSVRTELASLPMNNEEYPEAQKQLEELTKAPAASVKIENIAYAKYLLAFVYQKQKFDEKSITLLKKIISTRDVSNYRLGWTYNLLSEVLAKDDAKLDDAIAASLKSLEIEGGHSTSSVGELFAVYCRKDDSAAATQLLKTWLVKTPDQAKNIIHSIVGLAKLEPNKAKTDTIAAALTKAAESSEGEIAKLLTSTAKKLTRSSTLTESHILVRKELLALFKKHQRPYLNSALAKDAPITREAMEKHLDSIYDNQHDQWFACATKYFEDFEPGDKFSHYLWQLSTYVKWKSNLAAGETDFLKELFTLTEKLPTIDDNHWESQFTLALWHEEAQRWQEAIKIYEMMHNHQDFPDDFSHSSWHRHGKALERLGKWQEAITSHLKYKDERRGDYLVCYHIVRAGHIYLRMGKIDDAIKTWKLLKDVDASTWEDESPQTNIEEAIYFVDHEEKARAHWKSSATWWKESFLPAWKKLGYSPHESLPLFLHDDSDIGSRYQVATKDRDAKKMATEIFTVAYALRFRPSLLRAFNTAFGTDLLVHHRNQGKDIYDCIVAIAEKTRFGTSLEIAYAERLAVAYAFDASRHQKALELVELYLPDREKHSVEHQERMIWLYLLVTTSKKTHLKEAIAMGEKTWSKGTNYVKYHRFSMILAKAMMANNQQEKALKTLQTSITKTTENSEAHKQLKSLYEQLNKKNQGVADFNKAMQEWMGMFKPAWYDHVGPKTLEDKRIGKIDDHLNGNRGELHEIENNRLILLLANSESTSLDMRYTALQMAVFNLMVSLESWNKRQEVLEKTLAIESLHDTPKINILWSFYRRACLSGKTSYAEKASKNPHFKGLRKDILEVTSKNLLIFSKALKSPDTDQIIAAIEYFTKDEIDQEEITYVERLMVYLLTRGAKADYEKLRKSALKWRIKSKVSPNSTKLRMNLITSRNTYAKRIKISQNLRRVAMKVLKSNASKAPKNFNLLVEDNLSVYFSSEICDAIRAKKVVSGTDYDQTNLSSWFFNPTFWVKTDGKLNQETLHQAVDVILNADMEEILKFLSLVYIAKPAEKDMETIAKIRMQITEHLKTNQSNTSLQNAKFIYDYMLGLDTKQPVTSEQFHLRAKSSTDMVKNLLNSLATLAATSEHKPEKALQYAMGSQLASTSGTAIYNLLAILPKDKFLEEKELLLENAEITFNKQINECWLEPTSTNYISLCYLSQCRNNEASKIPSALTTYVWQYAKGSNSGNARLFHAWVQQDWNTLLAESKDKAEDDTAQFFKALALHKLKRSAEALPILKKLVNLSPLTIDEVPMAKRLLAEIESKPK